MEHIIINGELMRRELARLPVLDRSILWGEALATDILLRNSQPFRLEQHIDTLAASLRLPEIGIAHALSPRRIARDIATLASRSRIYDGRVRLLITPGCVEVEEEYGILLPQGVNELILLEPELYSEEIKSRGLRLASAPYRRLRGDPLAVHKFARSMREHVALRRAVAAGYDEAVIHDETGALLSTTRANIFVVVDGGVVTPHPQRDGVVPGVMRGFVIDTLAREGIMLYQESLSSELMAKADELFITSSGAGGVLRVAQLNEKKFAPGALTQQVAFAVQERMLKELPSI